jgi:hypothetical protein
VHTEENILRVVRRSLPSVTTRTEAVNVTARSVVHAMRDWIKVPVTNATSDPDRMHLHRIIKY